MKKNFVTFLVVIIIVLSLSITAFAAGFLTGNRFDGVSVASGTFGIGMSTPSTDLLSISGWSTNQIEFPYVNKDLVRFDGLEGVWTDGATEVKPAAVWTIGLNDNADPQDILYMLHFSGPAAKEAAENLILGVVIYGSIDGDKAYCLYSGCDGADGPWYSQDWYEAEKDVVQTPDIYMGTIDKTADVTIELTIMSSATSPIDGEFEITIDIYPMETEYNYD